MNCAYCDEPIEAGEAFPLERLPNLGNLHRECVIRVVVGSSAHQLGQCGCYGGTADERNSGITLRQDAILAEATFRSLEPKKEDWVN